MKYAEIINGVIAQVIETNAALPVHKQRANLLPIEDVTPTYDAATQGLGAETLTVEANRVARTWSVVTLPPREPTIEDKVAELEKRNAALEATLVEKAVLTKSEVNAKVDAIAAELAVEAEVKAVKG